MHQIEHEWISLLSEQMVEQFELEKVSIASTSIVKLIKNRDCY